MSPRNKTEFRQRVWKNGIRAVMLASAFFAGCSDNGTGPQTKSQLGSVTNFKAYSSDMHSVGLTWTAPPDTASPVFQQYQISTTLHSTLIGTTFVSKTATWALVGNLTEGIAYSFDIVSVALPGSGIFSNSSAATVQWAPARRLAPVTLYEIANGNGGLEFFDVQTTNPVVSPIGGAWQNIIDVFLDSSSAGDLVLKSAHLNPLAVVSTLRHTKFSTEETNSDILEIGSESPPALITYTQDFVTISSGYVPSGRIFYAVSSDSNFVRILVQPYVHSLIYGSRPNRNITIQLSYQFKAGVQFAKRSGQ